MQERISERVEYLNVNGMQEPVLFDLSKTGVCCHHSRKKEKDAIVTVKFNALSIKSRVVYCQERSDGFRLGLQFVQVAADQQKTLGDLVDAFSRGVPITCKVED